MRAAARSCGAAPFALLPTIPLSPLAMSSLPRSCKPDPYTGTKNEIQPVVEPLRTCCAHCLRRLSSLKREPVLVKPDQKSCHALKSAVPPRSYTLSHPTPHVQPRWALLHTAGRRGYHHRRGRREAGRLQGRCHGVCSADTRSKPLPTSGIISTLKHRAVQR